MELQRKIGTRAELTSELREMSEGWHHLCKDDLSAKAEDAANALESGFSSSLTVGHTSYEVDEAGDDATANR